MSFEAEVNHHIGALQSNIDVIARKVISLMHAQKL